MVWANQLSYKFNIANDHHFDALVGYEIDDQYRDYLSGYATNFATADKDEISNGMKTESVGGSSTRTRMVSYLTRVNYDYKNKYYLGGSFVLTVVPVCIKTAVGVVSGQYLPHGV